MPLEDRETEAPEDSLRSPLDDIFVDFLMSKNRESPDLDFKLTIDVSRYRFPEVAKDIFAMANHGGGYILIGFREKESGGYDRTGLPPEFHIDQADLQQKFNAYCSEPLAIGYREFDYAIDDETRKFALIQSPPGRIPLEAKNDGIVHLDGREKVVFRRGEILVRRGTQSTRASPSEIEAIKRRAEQTDYQISLISGNPDRIKETLYGTLFEVRRIPDFVFSGRLSMEQIPFSAELASPFVIQNPYLYHFADPTLGPLKPFVKEKTVESHKVEEWLAEKDHRSVILWLLAECLIWEGRQRGMYGSGKKLFYPLPEGQTVREESWPGVARGASRQVAGMMFASQLGETVGVHPAVEAHFTLIGEKLYLRLSPTYVLTRDGRHVRRGEEEGTVITSLSYDDYNMLYLRNLLFWVSKLGGASGRLRLLNGTIEVDAEPVTAKVDVGIRSDSPTLTSIKLELRKSEGG